MMSINDKTPIFPGAKAEFVVLLIFEEVKQFRKSKQSRNRER